MSKIFIQIFCKKQHFFKRVEYKFASVKISQARALLFVMYHICLTLKMMIVPIFGGLDTVRKQKTLAQSKLKHIIYHYLLLSVKVIAESTAGGRFETKLI